MSIGMGGGSLLSGGGTKRAFHQTSHSSYDGEEDEEGDEDDELSTMGGMSLKRHQEERRGRRANANNPYCCKQCNRSYSTPSNLRRHNKLKHGIC